VVDGGFLELVRYGIRAADDPIIVNTVKVIDAVLKVETGAGPVWHRYNHDGYGQKEDGGPFSGFGRWPRVAALDRRTRPLRTGCRAKR
jgi:glucoamylase